jgi:RimJ/RimL family protein N-acetyltransferase
MADIVNAFRSERLLYRAVESNEQDTKFLHEQIYNDPGVSFTSTGELLKPRSKEHAESQIVRMKGCLLAVMVCLPTEDSNTSKPTGTEPSAAVPTVVAIKSVPIGFVLLSNSGSASSHRYQHRTSELSISLAPAYHGKGYGTEAINWALDWAFRRANLHSVWLFCVEHNLGARKVYERVGFQLGGRLREAAWADRKWHDALMYSILEQEWETYKARQR